MKWDPFAEGGGGGGGRWLLLLASFCVAQLSTLGRGFVLAAMGLAFWRSGGRCCVGRSASAASWFCVVVDRHSAAAASSSSSCSLCSCCLHGRVLHMSLCMCEVSSVVRWSASAVWSWSPL